MGFSGTQTVALQVSGMDCQNCASGIERALSKRGLDEVFVNFQTGEVRFHRTADQLSIAAVKDEIEKLGYLVITANEGTDPATAMEAAARTATRRLIFCVALTLPLLLTHPLMALGLNWHWLHNPWWQLALALPVYVIGAWHFGRSALGGLRAGFLNMDVLIWLGATAAMVYSLVGLFWQDPDFYFFETSAGIITLVLVGNWLESRAVARTTNAIGSMLQLQADSALRITAKGAIEEVSTKDLIPGDVVQVNGGDRVPVDGIIKQGYATVDESLLTGESLPVDREPGTELIGGSLILNGTIELRVVRSAKDGTLAKMVELVKTAQQDKPESQRLADRVSAIFVPVVIVISILTFFLGWGTGYTTAAQAVLNAIAVLLISCPCAMGLATPTAVMVGVGRMARQGILVKGGQSVETLARVQRMVFDKTGTLTQGNIEIDRIEYLTANEGLINKILYAMERHSSHPIAKAIVKKLEPILDPLSVPELEIMENPGQGLVAIGEEGRFVLGSARVLQQEHQATEASVYLLSDQALLARLYLSDPPKSESADLIRDLEKRGVATSLLSGDSQERTKRLATSIGMTRYLGGQMPGEKLAYLQQETEQGITAMVGDGINDAAALSRADVGISMGDSSAVAIDAARVVILGNQMSAITKAIDLSRLTLRTIQESLFWAFSYNVVAIPLAALGYLSPLWAAAFMAFSDLVVIGNAIRLRYR
ncbi:MAG: cation-translocating P-type ATPase [Bacteroidota bacterium]